LASLIASLSCCAHVAELTLEVCVLLGVTGVGAVGIGMGVLVFDPADQAGAAVATDRKAIKTIRMPWTGARRFPGEAVINKVTADEPA
jgi:uncharacterized protein (UPF0210 family)